MNIDRKTIRKGTKKSWNLVAGETAACKVSIPVTAMQGTGDGPRLAVLAGCHPCELIGIMTSIRLAKEIDPKKLRGSLVIVHLQNIIGFQFKVANISPLDGVNMGRGYPIDEEKGEDMGQGAVHRGRSVTQQVAHRIFTEIISSSNYLIDLHGGELHESLYPNIEILPTGDDVTDGKTRSLAKAFGFDYVWEVPYGSIPEMPTYPGRGSSVVEAGRMGIPGVLCEVGGEGKVNDRDIERTFKGLTNVMIQLGMIQGKRISARPQTLIGGHVHFAKRGGLFLTKVEAGDKLSKGQVLGQIMNLSGAVVETLRAHSDGILLNMITLGIANPGDMLYVIGDIVG